MVVDREATVDLIRRLIGLNESTVYRFVRELTALNPSATLSVVLVGSVARGTATSRSDLDVVVLGEEDLMLPSTLPPIHVHKTTTEGFLGRLEKGDDFPAWAIRFGIPIVGESLWDRVSSSKEGLRWPDWHSKVAHAARRLVLAAALIEMDDEDAAAEEMLYAVSHLARAVLLREHVFPLSRSELAEQVEGLGYSRLCKLLEKLNNDTVAGSEIRLAQFYVKRLLYLLDTDTYLRAVRARPAKAA